jgi:hypothetical protein
MDGASTALVGKAVEAITADLVAWPITAMAAVRCAAAAGFAAVDTMVVALEPVPKDTAAEHLTPRREGRARRAAVAHRMVAVADVQAAAEQVIAAEVHRTVAVAAVAVDMKAAADTGRS